MIGFESRKREHETHQHRDEIVKTDEKIKSHIDWRRGETLRDFPVALWNSYDTVLDKKTWSWKENEKIWTEHTKEKSCH